MCTANTVEPTIADVDRKAVLGGELAERAYRVKLESRENGIGCGLQPADMSTKPEDADSGSDILCACLGGTSWCADDAIGPGSRTDVSRGEVDVSRGWADVPSMLNHAEIAMLGHRDSGGMYLGVGSHADT